MGRLGHLVARRSPPALDPVAAPTPGPAWTPGYLSRPAAQYPRLFAGATDHDNRVGEAGAPPGGVKIVTTNPPVLGTPPGCSFVGICDGVRRTAASPQRYTCQSHGCQARSNHWPASPGTRYSRPPRCLRAGSNLWPCAAMEPSAANLQGPGPTVKINGCLAAGTQDACSSEPRDSGRPPGSRCHLSPLPRSFRGRVRGG